MQKRLVRQLITRMGRWHYRPILACSSRLLMRMLVRFDRVSVVVLLLSA
jgi:hypothetical protein